VVDPRPCYVTARAYHARCGGEALVPWVRTAPSIGPGLCTILYVYFREHPFYSDVLYPCAQKNRPYG
jgi:hypothetical protein